MKHFCVKIKQSNYKPGSVSFVKDVRHSSIPDVTIGLKRSTLRLGRATLERRYTRTCSLQDARLVHRCTTGGLLPHLLTLTLAGGYFLLRYSALANSFLLGSGVLCAARTFLLCLVATATDRMTVVILVAKLIQIFLIFKLKYLLCSFLLFTFAYNDNYNL